MSFEEGKFTSAPIFEELNTLKKAELPQLVNHYQLMGLSSMPKSQTKIFITHLVNKEIITLSEDTEKIM